MLYSVWYSLTPVSMSRHEKGTMIIKEKSKGVAKLKENSMVIFRDDPGYLIIERQNELSRPSLYTMSLQFRFQNGSSNPSLRIFTWIIMLYIAMSLFLSNRFWGGGGRYSGLC